MSVNKKSRGRKGARAEGTAYGKAGQASGLHWGPQPAQTQAEEDCGQVLWAGPGGGEKCPQVGVAEWGCGGWGGLSLPAPDPEV